MTSCELALYGADFLPQDNVWYFVLNKGNEIKVNVIVWSNLLR